jgi:hypothetical protein
VIEIAVYLVIVLVIGGLGIRIGMIVAGRIDGRMNRAEPEPVDPPPTEEPS